MGRTLPPYHHDRDVDGPAVVHLRFGQGGLQPATPSSTSDARESEEEAGGCGWEALEVIDVEACLFGFDPIKRIVDTGFRCGVNREWPNINEPLRV